MFLEKINSGKQEKRTTMSKFSKRRKSKCCVLDHNRYYSLSFKWKQQSKPLFGIRFFIFLSIPLRYFPSTTIELTESNTVVYLTPMNRIKYFFYPKLFLFTDSVSAINVWYMSKVKWRWVEFRSILQSDFITTNCFGFGKPYFMIDFLPKKQLAISCLQQINLSALRRIFKQVLLAKQFIF